MALVFCAKSAVSDAPGRRERAIKKALIASPSMLAVKILLNKQRDAERTARNHRLIVHGAIMEGVFPFTASMEGEAVEAFLIALSRLPGAWETAQKAQKTGDEG